MILVTGAAGQVGQAVLSSLVAAGTRCRALYRRPADAQEAPPGVEAVLGDFSDADSMRRALAGVDAVFLVCAAIPALVDLEGHAIAACMAAGVSRVVLASALGAADHPTSFPSWHRQVEQRLIASGLSSTILRPNGFMQNIVAFHAGTIRSQGAFYDALGPARISYVDVRDVGAAAAAILLAPPADHAGRIYELHGPAAIGQEELAALIGAAIGRPVRYVAVPEAA
jgi:uncharacterized protein YbjT (DUF2867 family)